jgi:hypothetical protein
MTVEPDTDNDDSPITAPSARTVKDERFGATLDKVSSNSTAICEPLVDTVADVRDGDVSSGSPYLMMTIPEPPAEP